MGFPQPLAGMVVLDLTEYLPGPYCTSLLAAFGARVIKIEPPSGDKGRDRRPRLFEQMNCNKESVVLDLKHPSAAAVLHRMAESAHALVEGFRPSVMERLGVGYASLRERRASLVYCSISGFGQDGPYVDRAGHDLNFLAIAGYFSLPSQLDARITRPNVRLADLTAGQMAAFATAMALIDSGRSGRGCHVDAPIFDSVAAMAAPWTLSVPRPTAGTADLLHIMADSELYQTKDERYLCLGTLEDKFWNAFAEAASTIQPALVDLRFASRTGRDAHKHELAALLRDAFSRLTLAEWSARLNAVDTAWAPVYVGTEMFDDAHFKARRILSVDSAGRQHVRFPALFSGAADNVHTPAPVAGADTDDCLADLGFSVLEIGDLKARGVVR